MGNKTLVYKQKVLANLEESYKHFTRLETAFIELEKVYTFPLEKQAFDAMITSSQYLAYSDQCIYRFSKL